MKPNPTSPECQLALALCRLAHGCTLTALEDLFGESISNCGKIFNHVCRLLVARFYDRYVRLPVSDAEWEEEIKGFLENYEFPCIGAWDGFHVYITSKLKNFFSFKKQYTITNLGLVSYNRRFLYAAVGAPGSTHDARLLRYTSLYREIMDGGGIPNKHIRLGDFGNIPLVTIGDSAYPSFPWLLKMYNESTTTDHQHKYFNKRLCSARVVTENCYGMLKGRWRILYKKTEIRKFNLKYVIMSCIMLHNLCLEIDDPCKPRWRLNVKKLRLIDRDGPRMDGDMQQSNLNRMKISNWLWLDH